MVSPRSRTILFVVILAGMLLFPACLSSAGATVPLTGERIAFSQASQAQTTASGISVMGQGSVSVTPDEAEVWVGVNTRALTVAEAQTEASNRMAQIMDRLTALQIPREKITTVRYNVYPQYGQNQVLTGYQVDNVISVKIQNISQVGTLLDDVVGAGANRVERISFGVADPVPAANRAREAAMADARAKATQLARLAGVGLGRPIAVTESTTSTPPPVPFGAGVADAASAIRAVPVSPGENEITVTVQVTYAIE